MGSVIIGIVILVIILGSIIGIAVSMKKSNTPSGHITAFGESPADNPDES